MRMDERSSTGSYINFASEATTAAPRNDLYKSSAKSDSFSFGVLPVEHSVIAADLTAVAKQEDQ